MSRSRLSDFLQRHGVWAVAALVACTLALYPPALAQRLDLLAYDTLEPLFRTQTSAPEARIIAIDEASLATLGRWPWDRAIHAELINQLSAAGVAAIGMALLLTEPSPSDDQLAAALEASGRVVLALAPQSMNGSGVSELRPTAHLGAAATALSPASFAGGRLIPSQSASAARARSVYIFLRSAFFVRPAIGGNSPKLTFIG